jgi:mannose-1-phosphate guanylyltransferase/mannose-6-phosphate isomerase
MTSPTISSVVLCGGSGTRLWPLSRKSLPKQFVPLLGDKSLLRMTIERLGPITTGDMVCVAS